MRILIAGRCDGWMAIHMRHLSDGFRKLGHEVNLIDYHDCDKRRFPWFSFGEDEAARTRRGTAHLKSFISTFKPQLILLALAHLIFDFADLRKSFSGLIVFYDMDGPALSCYSEDLQWIKEIDLLVTVSRVTLCQLTAHGFNNIHHLAHGVDTDYYAPIVLSQAEKERFAAPLSFVGRPTARRAKLLDSIATEGLAVWGRRWSKKPYQNNKKLLSCVREKKNVIGMDLMKLYNATTLMVNILREPFVEVPTIMSLQVFAVPASRVCLLTEWVEEIEDAFEPDVQLLTFRNPEEFQEKARRYSKDPSAARRIGEAGRRRCLAEHTHAHRAEHLLRVLKC